MDSDKTAPGAPDRPGQRQRGRRRATDTPVADNFEWATVRMAEAFDRSTKGLLAAVGYGDVTPQEERILNMIRLHDHPKPALIVARLLNRDDLPNLQYSLRKLERSGLVEKVADERGKKVNYTVTAAGRELTERFAEVRRHLIIDQLQPLEGIEDRLRRGTRILSLLTGLYDEAGRISATYAPENS
ncbi:putative MarR family transcription regulator [Alkalispirillum mobile]|uniref:Putative MarR family transcription regulator n=1 Tax=Alkalispirillum mobile TaxID=85925 RepID=A0A498BX58_9GAMM|nr:winged helix DNA-binding protein [Alkalispirillum mobile]RLK48264.1 putative MarR family transcription regulator [Alkalispirillum mobile]